MAKYDDISWHYNDEFPKELEEKNAATHIGMFLEWIIKRGLESDFLKQIAKDGIEKVRNKEISGTDFLMKYLDGKLTSEDLSKEANNFASKYYETDRYLDDYAMIFEDDVPTLYHVKDTPENFEKIAKILDKRLEESESMGKKHR